MPANCQLSSESLPRTEIIESDGKPPIQGEGTVEFRLLYQGVLPANGNVADKFLIRRQLHPQLQHFWSEHPTLRDMAERWGAVGASETGRPAFEMGIERFADIRVNGFRFLPLSREEWFFRCSLDVLFLRREKPGRVFMRGDIDNRLKTLFDALRMPHTELEFGGETPRSSEDPFYVLLQDDELIADVAVTTDRLLQFPDEHQYTKDYAVLVIDVKLQPTKPMGWNWVFD